MFNLVTLLIQDNLNRAINRYGLEGCEEVIKGVYSQMPEIKNAMLKELKRRNYYE